MDTRNIQPNKRDKLAQDVLHLSRNTLLVNLRFLDMALSRLAYTPADCDSLMTDGERLIYNTAHVLRCYKAEKEIPRAGLFTYRAALRLQAYVHESHA